MGPSSRVFFFFFQLGFCHAVVIGSDIFQCSQDEVFVFPTHVAITSLVIFAELCILLCYDPASFLLELSMTCSHPIRIQKLSLIIAVIHTTYAVVKLKPEKKFRPERDSKP